LPNKVWEGVRCVSAGKGSTRDFVLVGFNIFITLLWSLMRH